MKLGVYYRLWQEKRRLFPRGQFKRALGRELSQAWLRKHGQHLLWYQTHWYKLAASVTASVVAVFSIATGAFAYTSSAVTEGTPLYPLKRGIEKVEENLQRTPHDKAKFYLKKIARREAEKKVMAARRQKLDNINKSIQRTENALAGVEKELDQNDHSLDKKAPPPSEYLIVN